MAEQDLVNFDVDSWVYENISYSSEVVLIPAEKIQNFETDLEGNNFSDISLTRNAANHSGFFNDSGNLQLPNDMVFGAGHLISVITYSFLFIFSLMGNATVLFVILQRRKKTSPFSRIDFMLIHLSIADLIVSLPGVIKLRNRDPRMF
ncbi:unnamed protein product [Allacma fusca]|uniref:G-protein coupled receptors family 1 profile domain-containing protein n=1 Tax=Allacma fusca TaxID=39272 RepID=A0A8J2LCZ6_9HEXA|nr:unnamed protein product [Allacma fusca]